nr:immunoglobulin heavy chain junction region [Macaca mulatta]MOW88011.1 immunoglobulin heavy chain junction region [Macaca mulatta]MOW91480.1 immunoglobulin heavy chain junction region [Macaca mulatta]
CARDMGDLPLGVW